MGYTEISVKDAWVYWIVWSMIEEYTLLCWNHFDRGYTEMSNQRFLRRLKILRYTENSVKVSKVYWKFRGYKLLKFRIRVLTLIWGYTVFLSMLKGILIMTTRAPQAKNSVYLGILKFFSMRVGGAPGVTCNADFQFPMALSIFWGRWQNRQNRFLVGNQWEIGKIGS